MEAGPWSLFLSLLLFPDFLFFVFFVLLFIHNAWFPHRLFGLQLKEKKKETLRCKRRSYEGAIEEAAHRFRGVARK